MPADGGLLREVVVEVALGGARKAAITGDFTGWSEEGIPLHRCQDSGGWRARLRLRPGTYRYRLRVDGRWADDPAAARRVANPYGGEDALLFVDRADDDA